MNSEILTAILTLLAGFLLKTLFAFGICWLFDRVIASPNLKFIAWLSFLFGSAGYWLFLAAEFLGGSPVALATQPVNPPDVQIPAALSDASAWQIPAALILPISFVLCVAGAFYIATLGYLLFASLRKHMNLRWVLRFAWTPPVAIADIFRPLARRFRLDRATLLILSGITSPATIGWLRPIIVLPDLCVEQDRSELADVLRHELHHIRRWDFVWNGIASICRMIIFFHPGAGYALRRMQFQRELACDLAVVSEAPERRVQYAQCLVHFARIATADEESAWGIDFAASAAHLKGRIYSLLAYSEQTGKWLPALRTASGLALLAISISFLPSLTVVFSYAPQPTTQLSVANVVSPEPVIAKEKQFKRKALVPMTIMPSKVMGLIATKAPSEEFPPELWVSNAHIPKLAQAPTDEDPSEALPAVFPPSEQPSTSPGPTSLPQISGIHRPSFTSVLRDAVIGIARGDHDHDRHFQ
jgi:beta-lactamase regulating signal transducer with metallopeptidase domain